MAGAGYIGEVVVRWGYLYDNIDEECGGGFVTGEFALDSKGHLWRRWATDGFRAGVTTWRADAWSVVEAWEPSLEQDRLIGFLTGRGYDLYPPTPIPVNELSAGPFSGMPTSSGEPLFAAYSRPSPGG